MLLNYKRRWHNLCMANCFNALPSLGDLFRLGGGTFKPREAHHYVLDDALGHEAQWIIRLAWNNLFAFHYIQADLILVYCVVFSTVENRSIFILRNNDILFQRISVEKRINTALLPFNTYFKWIVSLNINIMQHSFTNTNTKSYFSAWFLGPKQERLRPIALIWAK